MILASVFAIGSLTAGPVMAQGQFDSRAKQEESRFERHQTRQSLTTHERRRGEQSDVVQVPDWAESQSPRSGGEASYPSGIQTKADDDPGRAVPIDGGLIWLFLLGVGYGLFRLRVVEPRPTSRELLV